MNTKTTQCKIVERFWSGVLVSLEAKNTMQRDTSGMQVSQWNPLMLAVKGNSLNECGNAFREHCEINGVLKSLDTVMIEFTTFMCSGGSA